MSVNGSCSQEPCVSGMDALLWTVLEPMLRTIPIKICMWGWCVASWYSGLCRIEKNGYCGFDSPVWSHTHARLSSLSPSPGW